MKTFSQFREEVYGNGTAKDNLAKLKVRQRDRQLHHYNREQHKVAVGEEFTPEELHEARIKVIKARVRGGKVQRRKKVSNVKGYTMRGGKLTKMSPQEKMDRKRGARKAKSKIRAKAARAAVKRRRSMRKRASIGL